MGTGTGLLGRDADLARLGDAVARAREGALTPVLIEGDAGIGKSRLLTEALAAFRDPKDRVALGHGVELIGGELPYGTITDTLRTLSRDAGVPVVREAAGTYVSQLAALYRPLHPDAGNTAAADRIQLLLAYVTALESLGRDRLVWLVIEDLHWVDASSRDVLTYALRVTHACQLLVLFTVRTHDPPTDPAIHDFIATLATLPHVERLALTPLNEGDTATLVTDLNAAATASQVDRVVALAQGSPLLVEQLVAAGLDSDGRAPESISAPMTARIRHLDPNVCRLVQIASLADGQLVHRLLKGAFDDDTSFDQATGAALDTGLLTYDPAESAYAFSHALLRQAAADTLKPAARMAGHRRWAEVLARHHEGDLPTLIAIAHHWHAADQDSEAFVAALEAADQADRISASAEAATLRQRALALWDRVPEGVREGFDRDTVLGQCVGDWESAGNLRAGHALLQAELAAPGSATRDPQRHLCLALSVSFLLDLMGEPPDRRLLDEGMKQSDALCNAEPDPLVVGALNSLAWHIRVTDPEKSLRLHQRMYEMGWALDEPGVKVVVTLNYKDQAIQRARFEEAIELCTRAFPHAANATLRVELELGLVETLEEAGRFADALEVLERVATLLPNPELSPGSWLFAQTLRAQVLHATGEVNRARDLLAAAFAVDVDSVQADHMTWAFTEAGELECLLGNVDAARSHAVRARQLLPGTGDSSYLTNASYVRCLEADIATLEGNLVAARGIVEPSLHAPVLDVFAALWPSVSTAARIEGDIAQSIEQSPDKETAASILAVRSAVERLPRAGAHHTARHIQATADLARAERTDTPTTWAEAVDAWRNLGHVPNLGWANLRLAHSLVQTGDRASATAPLTEAWTIAHRLGAVPQQGAAIALARRARILLDVGDRGGHPVRTGLLARLTERELEVLRHVALGETNDEVAAALFISPKTVSVHVSRILSKLDVTSRAKATVVAYDEGMFVDGGA